MMDIPFEFVKSRMEAGDAPPSMTRSLLESCIKTSGRLTSDDERDIKGVTGTLSAAASETTVSVIESFFLAMVLHPEVQKKAQEELDRVIGGDRLPTLDDRDSLPYLESVVKEIYRWSKPVPLGLPHRLMENDIYRGYFLPKGSTIVSNIYGILQNCPEPDSFKPERFMTKSDMPDPRDIVFGFGRRICPGRHFAESNIWLIVSLTLSLLQIDKRKDANGVGIELSAEFTSGFTRKPVDVRCSVSPRSFRLLQHVLPVDI